MRGRTIANMRYRSRRFVPGRRTPPAIWSMKPREYSKHSGPRNPRFARQSDRRSRRRARVRRARPRGRAVGRLHRHPRGARTARRRQAPLRRARASRRPSATSTARLPRRSRGKPADQRAVDAQLHRARRHAEPRPPRRERRARRVDGRRARAAASEAGKPLYEHLASLVPAAARARRPDCCPCR